MNELDLQEWKDYPNRFWVEDSEDDIQFYRAGTKLDVKFGAQPHSRRIVDNGEKRPNERNNMNYDEFLEMNGQKMTEKEWEEMTDLDEEFHAQILHMEYLIQDLEDKLDENNESVDDIIEIEQDEPGHQFWVWTKHRVYYSDEEDHGDQLVVRSTFRRPAWAVANHR